MSVPMNVIDAEMPAITELVNDFVSIIKNNNDTKVALAKIEAALHESLTEIYCKHDLGMRAIDVFSSKLDKALVENNISYELRLKTINLCIDAILKVAGYN